MEASVQIDSIVAKQRKRYALLKRVYELTNGDETKPIILEPPENIQPSELLSIIDYLSGEGLLESLADNAPFVRISHRGVVEVEESLLNPTKPTEHFLSQVIQHFHGSVGSVQTGNQNIAYVTQQIADLDVRELIKELRKHLMDETSDVKREGGELLDGLEAELSSGSKSESRIKLYLNGLAAFVKDTGKELLVEITSKVITNQMGLSG
jgi:hypothetical protein